MEEETLTLTGLLKGAAAAHPSRRALAVHGRIDLAHAALDALVDAAATRLAAGADGVRPGLTVALCFPNTVELVITFLAVIRARAVAAPMNPAYTQEEFEFYLSDSEACLHMHGLLCALLSSLASGGCSEAGTAGRSGSREGDLGAQIQLPYLRAGLPLLLLEPADLLGYPRRLRARTPWAS